MKALSFARSLILALLITLLLVASAPFLKALSEAPQTQWSSTAYYGYSASCVIETEDGGLAAGGTAEIHSAEGGGTTAFRTMLVKTNSSGQMQWSRTYGSDGLEISASPRSVFQTNDSGYILSGHNGWLLKTDAEGNMEWFKTIEPRAYYNVIQTSDGRYVLAGFDDSSDSLYATSYLLKINQNGNTVWMKTFGGSDLSVYLNAVVEANDSGYVVAGSWEGAYWLAETDIHGGLLWNKTYSYENYWRVSEPRINSVARTEDGGYILAGGDGGGAWLIKVDSEGNEQWNRPYLDGEFFQSVAQSADGGYVLTGWYGDAWSVKVDSSGNLLWTASYVDQGGPRTSYAATSTVDGGYAVAGQLAKSLWLAKFAPELAPSPEIPSPSPEYLPSLFPIIWIVTAVIIVAVVGVGLLLYFKKRKH